MEIILIGKSGKGYKNMKMMTAREDDDDKRKKNSVSLHGFI